MVIFFLFQHNYSNFLLFLDKLLNIWRKFRIWRLNDPIMLPDIVRQYEEIIKSGAVDDKTIYIDGDVLQAGVPIEEAEIEEHDTLLVEFNHSQNINFKS